MAKLFRVEAYVVDVNGDTKADSIRLNLENSFSLHVNVKDIQETEAGEWYDDHELNKRGCDYKKYFPDIYPGPDDLHLKKEYQRVRTIMLQQIDRCQRLERHCSRLGEEIDKLKKVQEFIKTIGDLTR